MKAPKLFSILCAGALVFGSASMLTACSEPGSEEQTPVEGLTGGVAATVNGTEIEEDTVTTYIQNLRTYYGLSEEADWGEYLVSIDQTPTVFREDIIDIYVKDKLLEQAAVEREIEVPEEEIDEAVAKIKDQYDSDEAWQEGLNGAGFTDENAYREAIKESLTDTHLREDVVGDQTPSDEEVLEYAEENISNYDGAKKSSHILFAAEDEATAQEVLDKINSGELDFAEAATEYSTDSSAADGGNVGWDKFSSFVTEYTTALAELEKDQVSGLVTSQYGIHIIKCTDVFNVSDVIAEEKAEGETQEGEAPAEEEVASEADEASTDESTGDESAEESTEEDTSVTLTGLNDLPEDFVETFTETVLSTKENEAYDTWYEEYKEAADIVINDMPENVPYNLDIEQYKEAAEEEAAEEEAAAEDGAAVEDDVATGESEEAPAEGESADSSTDEADSATEESADSSSGAEEQDASEDETTE